MVDTRPVPKFAGHVPGALSIPLRAVFATWLGALARPDRPLVIVRGPAQAPQEIATQALKVGYAPAGELAGGVEAWTAEQGELTATRLVRPEEVGPTSGVLDAGVRRRPPARCGAPRARTASASRAGPRAHA